MTKRTNFLEGTGTKRTKLEVIIFGDSELLFSYISFSFFELSCYLLSFLMEHKEKDSNSIFISWILDDRNMLSRKLSWRGPKDSWNSTQRIGGILKSWILNKGSSSSKEKWMYSGRFRIESRVRLVSNHSAPFEIVKIVFHPSFELYSIQSHLPSSGYTDFGGVWNQTPSEQEEGGLIKANAMDRASLTPRCKGQDHYHAPEPASHPGSYRPVGA